jgi:hypothetical protein
MVMTPSTAEVERIAALQDPVLRNLQITQCYHELSEALSRRTGLSANWCTFATWASKQAGQSIRKEDLLRFLERQIRESTDAISAAQEAALQAQSLAVQPAAGGISEGGIQQPEISPEMAQAAVQQALRVPSIMDRVSDAVGRGNRKVFEEIGREFARFLSEFEADTEAEPARLEQFCAGLREGEPPSGQTYLRQAFRRCYRSFFIDDPDIRAELLLCSNLEIGFHEQTRLQPEISEALNAAFSSDSRFARLLVATRFPFSGSFLASLLFRIRLLGRGTAFDRAIQDLLSAVRTQIRRLFTETLMVIHFPPNQLIRLGHDLECRFPPTLRHLAYPDLLNLLERLDPTPDSLKDSGAVDWSDLPDRMHFIVDLFRCYQETNALFEHPFTAEQVADLKSGRIPSGRL